MARLRISVVAAVGVGAVFAGIAAGAILAVVRTPERFDLPDWEQAAQGEPDALSLPPAAEAAGPVRPAGPVIPEALAEPTAQERFAARLASLAERLNRAASEPIDTPALGDFDREGLSVALTALLGGYEDDANLSVHVRDLVSEQVVFDYYGDTPLIPASNQKLVTSSAAIDLLGADYTFETVVSRTDKALYIRGEGDPSLNLDDLTSLANTIAERVELTAIDRLVVDDTAFSVQRFGPGYSAAGPGYAYEAPSGALSLDYNTVEATVYPVRGTSKPGVRLSVPGEYVTVDNRARVGTRNTLSVRTQADGAHTVLSIRGRIKRKTHSMSVRRRIYDPGLFAGSALAELLAMATASRTLPVERGETPLSAEFVHSIESEPLIEVLDAGLAYSNNFIAEQVLRTLAWRTTGDPGDWDAGQQILHDYWAALVGDEHFVAENGAGLTRTGRATTEGLVDLLALAYRAHGEDHGLIDALPVAGEAGTMRARLTRSGRRVRAKTGTMDGVSGLTGVITTESGEPQVGFSILINASKRSLTAPKRRRIEDMIVMHVLQALDDFAAGSP